MLEILSELHARLGTTSLLYFAVISVWGYFRFFRKQGVDSSFWGVLAIAEVLVVAQALLGGYLWLAGARLPVPGERQYLHILYGALIPVMIPAAYLYTRGRSSRAEILVYATTTIITAGLIIRASYTAQFAP